MRSRSVRHALGVLAVVALSTACPPAGTSVSQHTRTSVTPEVSNLQSYRQTTEAQNCAEILSGICTVVESEARARGVTIVRDGALSTAAGELARRVQRDPRHRPPSATVVQSLGWLSGVTDPVPTVLTVTGSGEWSAEARGSLREVFGQDRPNRYGVGRCEAGGETVTVVLLTQRRAVLSPVRREFSVGERLGFHGRLLEGLRQPTVVVTRPDGTGQSVPMGPGPEFEALLALDQRGSWQVELTAEGALGATVVANFPVYVGVRGPSEVEGASDDDTRLTAVEVEQRLLELMNTARRGAGLRALETLPVLVSMARAHSVDMAENHFVAHTSPAHGTTTQRFERAGILGGTALENVARGYGARDIHESLMASPGHRANVLNSNVTHVGIGVVRESGPSGGWLVTEEFLEVTPGVDRRASEERLLTAANGVRAARGLRALTVDPVLENVARQAAERWFERPGESQESVIAWAREALRARGVGYRRVGLAVAIGPRLDGAERTELLVLSEMVSVGVGVAQGDRPGRAPNELFVVWVVAAPR